ncbi:MAG: hypothetical protein Q9210_006851 [Variospora velana]
MIGFMVTLLILPRLNVYPASPSIDIPRGMDAGSGRTAHLPDQPGNVQNDDHVRPSEGTCRSAGVRYWKTLRDTLANSTHDDRADGKALYDAYYQSETIPLSNYGSGVRPNLQALGLDWQKTTLWASTSKDPKTGEEAFGSAYVNILDTANGIMIAVENTSDYDESRKLNWSETIYQTWRRAMVLETEYAREKKPWMGPRGVFIHVQILDPDQDCEPKDVEDYQAGVPRPETSDTSGRGDALEAVDAGEDAEIVLCATRQG